MAGLSIAMQNCVCVVFVFFEKAHLFSYSVINHYKLFTHKLSAQLWNTK